VAIFVDQTMLFFRE